MIKKAFHFFNNKIHRLEKSARTFDRFYSAKAIGVNIGPRFIDIMQIKKGYLKMKIISSLSFRNPLNVVTETRSEDEELFIAEIKGYLDKSDGDWDEVVVGLPRNQIILKDIVIPAPDKKMIPDILKYEVDKYVPFLADSTCYDYQVISESEKNQYNLLFAAAREESVEYYLTLLNRAGLSPTIIDTSTCAIVNYLAFNKVLDNRSVVIANMEKGHVEIIVTASGDIVLSRSSVYNSDNGDIQGKDMRFKKFIIEEIFKTITNYSHLMDNGNNSAHIILSGFEEYTEIKEELEGRTGLKCIVVDEKLNLNTFNSHSVSAIGLALRGLVSTPITLDLLPNSFKRRHRRYSGLIFMFLVVTVLMFIPAIGISVYLKNISRLEAVNRLLNNTRKDALSVEEIYLKADELKKQFTSFDKIMALSISKLNIINELSNILPDSVWIKSININGRDVEIRGYADSASPIIKILEESGVFKDVKFDGRITKDKEKEKFKLKAQLEI